VSGRHILAISGGVGGAKLAAGLAAVMAPEDLTIVVNTGDDFEHLGLSICPDIDSVVYALAGLNDSVRGWGVADESWQAMAMLRRLGEADWFNLGDRDLGMHLARSWRLRGGETLSVVTARLTRALGIGASVVPMSDDPVRTQLCTDEGWLDFQAYFVERQCAPAVSEFRFAGAEAARPAPAFEAALKRPDLAAIVLCPSNPFLSVDPVLAMPGMREAIAASGVPVIAVSPLVGGRAIKGPLGKLLGELDQACDNAAIARHYAGLVSHFIIDESDRDQVPALSESGLMVIAAPTVMTGAPERERLARLVLSLAA
jgi:LPPG:FO 2-phospho-L-lactate transferase